MTNKHAAECRDRIAAIDIFDMEDGERIDRLGRLACEYAARCDALEAKVRRMHEGLELVA